MQFHQYSSPYHHSPQRQFFNILLCIFFPGGVRSNEQHNGWCTTTKFRTHRAERCAAVFHLVSTNHKGEFSGGRQRSGKSLRLFYQYITQVCIVLPWSFGNYEQQYHADFHTTSCISSNRSNKCCSCAPPNVYGATLLHEIEAFSTLCNKEHLVRTGW